MIIKCSVQTDFLKDEFCIPVLTNNPKEAVTLEWIKKEIMRRYRQWHKFPVYEFEFMKNKGTESTSGSKENGKPQAHVDLDTLNDTEKRNTLEVMEISVTESERSKLERAKDERRMEEKHREASLEAKRKRELRREMITKLKISGYC